MKVRDFKFMELLHWKMDRYYPYCSVYLTDVILEIKDDEETHPLISKLKEIVNTRLKPLNLERTNKSVFRFINGEKEIFLSFYDGNMYIGLSFIRGDSGNYFDLSNNGILIKG